MNNLTIALIGAGATILAALIGLFIRSVYKKNVSKKRININQNQRGNNNTQIGIQINKGDDTDGRGL